MSKVTQRLKADDFKIYIDDDVYRKVFYWVHKSDHEVSGFGNVEFDQEKKVFTVTDAMLLKQENGPTSSEIDPEAIGEAMFEAHKKGQPNGLKWWWHSHVNMSVFWSADDMECIRKLGHNGWILATVFNKRHESRSAFLQTVEIMGNNHEMFVDEIETEVNFRATDEEKKAWDEEYEAKVKAARPSANYYRGNIHRAYPMTPLEEKMSKDYMDSWFRDDDDFEMMELHSNHIAPKQRKGFPNFPNFSRDGWSYAAEINKDIYNPVMDRDLNDKERIEECWAMACDVEEEEFNFLMRKHKKFRKFVNKHVDLIEEEESGSLNTTV